MDNDIAFLAVKTSKYDANFASQMTEKNQKFRELAEKRTNNAIEAILRIGKLSNRQLYAYGEPDVKKIMKALRDTLSEIEERFSSPHGRGRKKFTL